MKRYREIEVSGSPREMGRQIGEAARDEIRGFCEVALTLVNKTARVSSASAEQVIADAWQRVEQYSPDMQQELLGIAEGARVFPSDVMLLQIRNQLQPDADAGCTSFSVASADSAGARRLVAQNWDNDPELQPFTVVLTRRPTGKPALMNITQAGLIAYIGFNEAGIGVCLNTLPAPSRRFGLPHYFTVRGIYESDSLAATIQAVKRAERAIPANIMLTTPQGPADLEVTIEDVYVLRDEANRCVTHANHCRHPELQSIDAQFPELIQSHDRQQRIDRLLEIAPRRSDLEQVKELLRNHEDFPYSLCRHPNNDPQTGGWQTVFSAIIEPESRCMHVSRGTPCEHPYETYHLDP